MKRCIVLFLSVLILVGCAGSVRPMDDVLLFRQQLSDGQGCRFRAEITADYGDRIYCFTLDCQTNVNGDMDFAVVLPDTIAGICGEINQTGGKITFNDKVLLFDPLSQGQMTPIIAPWLMLRAIYGGYIRSVADSEQWIEATIDDSLGTEDFQAVIAFGKDMQPVCCEIFSNHRRILTVRVTNFENL